MQPSGHDLVRSHKTNKMSFSQYFRWKTSLKGVSTNLLNIMHLLKYLISTVFSFSVSLGQQAFNLACQGQAPVITGQGKTASSICQLLQFQSTSHFEFLRTSSDYSVVYLFLLLYGNVRSTERCVLSITHSHPECEGKGRTIQNPNLFLSNP